MEEILQKRRGAAGETGPAGVVKRRVPREPGGGELHLRA